MEHEKKNVNTVYLVFNIRECLIIDRDIVKSIAADAPESAVSAVGDVDQVFLILQNLKSADPCHQVRYGGVCVCGGGVKGGDTRFP